MGKIIAGIYELGEELGAGGGGIGSFENSEIASTIIVEGIERWLSGIIEFCPKNMSLEDLIADLEESLYELNEIICGYRDSMEEDLGCAMSLTIVIDNKYYIFHAGDTRIFSLNSKIAQLTQDHTIFKDINGRKRKLLCNYMGKKKDFYIEKLKGRIKKGQLLFLATDGVYSKLTKEDVLSFKDVKEDKKADELCYQLLRVIMAREERDNVSCAIVGVK